MSGRGVCQDDGPVGWSPGGAGVEREPDDVAPLVFWPSLYVGDRVTLPPKLPYWGGSSTTSSSFVSGSSPASV